MHPHSYENHLIHSTAIRLYREAGFAAFGTEPRAIVVQGHPHAKVHMHRSLT